MSEGSPLGAPAAGAAARGPRVWRKNEVLKGVGERTWGLGGLDLGRGGLGKGCSSTGAGVTRFLPNYTFLCPPGLAEGLSPPPSPRGLRASTAEPAWGRGLGLSALVQRCCPEPQGGLDVGTPGGRSLRRSCPPRGDQTPLLKTGHAWEQTACPSCW